MAHAIKAAYLIVTSMSDRYVTGLLPAVIQPPIIIITFTLREMTLGTKRYETTFTMEVYSDVTVAFLSP